MERHFTRYELIRSQAAKEHEIDNSPPAHVLPNLDFTIAGLERLRAFLGCAMVISSGYRSPQLNAQVGGAIGSQHLIGQAADFTCPEFGNPAAVFDKLKPVVQILGIDQMILEKTWVHVSFTLEPRYSTLRARDDGTMEHLA